MKILTFNRLDTFSVLYYFPILLTLFIKTCSWGFCYFCPCTIFYYNMENGTFLGHFREIMQCFYFTILESTLLYYLYCWAVIRSVCFFNFLEEKSICHHILTEMLTHTSTSFWVVFQLMMRRAFQTVNSLNNPWKVFCYFSKRAFVIKLKNDDEWHSETFWLHSTNCLLFKSYLNIA